jgi:DNA-binding LacI/PurR family transcriptional regulator
VITTVCQPVYEVGRLLAQTLLKRIKGEESRVTQSLIPTLFLEQSVAKIDLLKEDIL